MRNSVVVKGVGVISPQEWNQERILDVPVESRGDRLHAIEPDYSQWFTPQALRRASRILKMGSGAATIALLDAGVSNPDGIITGTGYGCLEDTGTFLRQIFERNETALNPTPFMQSTHNTIGSQIALALQCRGYNQTYTQLGFSFEHALMDAMIQLREKPHQSLLVVAADETTDASYSIHKRFGKYRPTAGGSLPMPEVDERGMVAGEGACALVVSSGDTEEPRIAAVKTLYRPDMDRIHREVEVLLGENDITTDDIDLVLSGVIDGGHESWMGESFATSSIGAFKHLCGEYCVSSSFATALGVEILRNKHVPPVILKKDTRRTVRNVLIHNSYFWKYHSFILLRS